ncbi:hypothetical protein F5B17DRAFT_186443 [Nemania serpens]|nr:hypothetical protein F5B17DRAFT_186443 [Nemania serpens]
MRARKNKVWIALVALSISYLFYIPLIPKPYLTIFSVCPSVYGGVCLPACLSICLPALPCPALPISIPTIYAARPSFSSNNGEMESKQQRLTIYCPHPPSNDAQTELRLVYPPIPMSPSHGLQHASPWSLPANLSVCLSCLDHHSPSSSSS